MFTRRLSITLLTMIAVAIVFSAEAKAGCLDWLFGSSSQPYAVQYAPYAATSQAPLAPYAAQYAPAAPTTIGYGAAPTALPLANGAYQAQRPAYLDNPSVYTGRPVITTPANAQTFYSVPVTGSTFPYMAPAPRASVARVPIADALRGNASPVFSNNIVPSNYQAAYPASSSPLLSTVSPGLPLTSTAPVGTPPSAIPTTQVAPLFVNTPPPRNGVLARFFSSLFGTNYRSSYYRAPITYYRPVTSVDPVTGATVIVQQPCTSTVQQLQRTPYASLQLGQGAIIQQPAAGCQNPAGCQSYAPLSATTNNISPYGDPNPYAGMVQTPPGSVGQVGGYTTPGVSGVAPIPSTAPGYYQQPGFAPNTAPLTGAPPASNGDLAPIDQPQLQSPTRESMLRQESTPIQRAPEPPAPESTPKPTSEDPPRSYWDSRDAEDLTAMNAIVAPAPADRNSAAAPPFTGLTPIKAPDDYKSPFKTRNFEMRPNRPAASSTFEAPPLPERSYDPSGATSVSARVSVPVRDASLTRNREARPAPQPVRSNSGWRTINP